MPLTVRDLLMEPGLRLRCLVEGRLARRVRWVHSIDLVDPSVYLRGGEVVLTTGLWEQGAGSSRRFVTALAEADTAAIGFGVNAQVPHVPDELVEAAREHDLTLFVVPRDVPFIAVAEVFVRAEAEDRERPMRDALIRNRQLVASLQHREGLEALLRLLVRYRRGGAAVLVRRGHGPMAVAGAAGPRAALVAAVDRSGDRLFDEERDSTTAIPTEPTVVLVVSEANDGASVQDQTVIEQVSAYVAIEYQRLRTMEETERRYTAELLDLLSSRRASEPAVIARLRSLGLDLASGLVALCVEAPDPDSAGRALEELHEREGRSIVWAIREGLLLAIVTAGDVVSGLPPGGLWGAALDPDIRLGVGSVACDVVSLHAGLQSARSACRFAVRHGLGCVRYDELASHRVLISVQEEELLHRFQSALIQPLSEYDGRHHGQLVATLDRFLSSGGHYQETAQALHVHVNTLRLRLGRIEELTGRDLSTMEDRVDFWLALRARDLRESDDEAR